MRWPWDRKGERASEDPRHEVLVLISRRLKECEDTLARNPDDVDALFTKGVFLARIGEYWRSLECLKRAASLDPEYPGVWHLQSSLYQRVGDHGNARACRERAQAE